MADIQYVNIGRTMKAHGLTGEIKIWIEEKYLEDFMKNERIFLEHKGVKIPYFIANLRGAGEMILKLEDVNDRDAAIALQSKNISLRSQDLLKEEEREFEMEEEPGLQYKYLEGYTIEDKTLGLVGKIAEVVEMPQQEMAFLTYKKAEVLIPLNEQFIVSIDKTQQRVLMDLPEGLLD